MAGPSAGNAGAARRHHDTNTLHVFLIAGEPSGDALGGSLVSALGELSDRPLRLSGVGGPAMAGQGLNSLFDYSELAVMGLIEILPHVPRLLRRVRQVAAAITADPPDVLITIDAPGFVFRVIKQLSDRSFPRIHYVAPSVWAWRPNRVFKFRRHFDHLLALLPFEPDYFQRVGLPCTFVGHPVVEASSTDSASGLTFRSDHDLSPQATLLCVLPGSRAGELDHHLAPFAQTVELMARAQPDLHVVVPTQPHLQERIVQSTAGWPAPVIVVSSDPAARAAAMAASDIALAASGTVTLELARLRVPTIVAYRVAPVTAWILRRLIRVEYASIVNLIAGRAVVPEFVQKAMRPDVMAGALQALLSDTDRRSAMQEAQANAMGVLGEGGEPPSRRAARVVLDVVRDWRKTGTS